MASPLEYFAYHEDTELSLRLWQRGRTVEYVPDAVVAHHIEHLNPDTLSAFIDGELPDGEQTAIEQHQPAAIPARFAFCRPRS